MIERHDYTPAALYARVRQTVRGVMRTTVVPDFEALLSALRAGSSLSEAEVAAGYPSGTIAIWQDGRELGERLTREMPRLDAVLQIRDGLKALDIPQTVEPVKVRQDDHPHHFDIPPASDDDGGIAEGVCRICGLKKGFSNSIKGDGAWRAQGRRRGGKSDVVGG